MATTNDFPLTTWHAEFEEAAFDLDFTTPGKMTFTATKGFDDSETVDIEVTEIADSIHAIHWKESTGLTVVLVANLATDTADSFATMPDGTFPHWRGQLTIAS